MKAVPLSHSMGGVLVLMGGPDAERQVSLCSGKEVAQALETERALNRLSEIGVASELLGQAPR